VFPLWKEFCDFTPSTKNVDRGNNSIDDINRNENTKNRGVIFL
jgi:hypothetical protein